VTVELGPFDPDKAVRPSSDTSFEVELDEQPEPLREPVYVDVVSRDHPMRPVIPAYLRSWDGVKGAARRWYGMVGHHAAYHAVRALPLYLPLGLFWAVVGVFRLAVRQVRWWWVPEVWRLEQDAANRGGTEGTTDYLRAHQAGKSTRLFRGIVLLVEVGALLVCVVSFRTAPTHVQLLFVAVLVPVLARAGRPDDRPIIRSATVATRWRKLNSDIVLRAYYAAGLGHPDKPGQQVEFLSTMARDATQSGSQVMVALPYGKGWADMTKPATKSALASGLDVSEFQVFLTRDRASERSHLLYVADVDPLAIPAGKTPMLDGKQRNIWRPFFGGLDERGRKVTLLLLWISILVGAQPRKGKTFTARLFALYAALDPWVRLFIVDGKNSPDWRQFALVADRMIYGTTPNRDGDPIEKLIDTLELIKAHIIRVNEVLSTLPVEVCPEGKLTEELARDPRYPDLRVWMLVMEEFQVYFETEDQDVNKQIAGLLSFIISVGPSAGVILVDCSQKPSGVGAGDVQRLFNRFRDNHTARIALKCGNRDVSVAVLGGDAYQEGYDASALPTGLEYRGVGYLYGVTDDTPLTRWHLADKVDVELILRAARGHRERLGLLFGEAAGEVVEVERIDPLADARGVFYAGEAHISWPELAARLAEHLPERYADITAEAVSARLRALGVKGKNVKDPKHFPGGSGQGCARAAIEAAMAKKAVSA
jgi:hypothetical protein